MGRRVPGPLLMGLWRQGARSVVACFRHDLLLKQGGLDAFSVFITNTFYFPPAHVATQP